MVYFALITILFILILYYYGVRSHGYWKRKGIKHKTPIPYFGNNLKQFVQRASISMLAEEHYKMFPNEKVIGFYRGTRPELILRDPDIIRRVLVSDFQHFYARGLNFQKTDIEPLLKNLVFADGDLWHLLRPKFSPLLSSGKIRAIFPIAAERAAKLQLVCKEIRDEDSIDIRELMARFTTDFIGVFGFGINIDSLDDETSQFRKLGKRILQRTPRDAAVFVLKVLFTERFKHLHFLAPEIEKSMVHLVQTVMKQRNYKSSGRNDFIDLIMDIKRQGSIVGESIEKRKSDGSAEIIKMEIDDMILIAQVFIVFGAGFETTSSASSYTLHQLAFHPEYQKRVQKEIDTVLGQYDNQITYDAINEMRLLDMAFHESMRMYPPVGFLGRTCVSPEYSIPEINLTIKAGMRLLIPVKAIHNDEKYFRNPEKFHPERFSPVSKEKKSYVYMPFGDGPRYCIGARLGKMLALAGIAAILQKFTVEPAKNSIRDPRPDPTAILTENFLDGLPLKLRSR